MPQTDPALLQAARELLQGNRPAEAAALLESAGAGKTRDADLTLFYADALDAAGKRDQAVQICHRVIQWQPDYGPAYAALGRRLLLQNQFPKALSALQTAARLLPESATVHVALAQALSHSGRKTEALKTLERAASLDPKNAEAQLLLGIACRDTGDLPAAERALCAAIAIDPRNPAPLRLLGRLLESTGRRPQAIACYQTQALVEPQLAEPHHRIGESRRALGQWIEALAAYDEALKRDRSHILAHGGRALALLALGRYREGWQEYEWRWQADNFPMKKPRLPMPEWTGQPLDGKTLLVYAEQGLGDTIMLARYVPLLAARGAKIILQVPESLVALLASLRGAKKIIPDGADPGPADLCISTFSLPRLMGTTLENIPAEIPYLFADPERIARWSTQLDPLPRPRIGICWAGNPLFFRDARRSIPFAALAPLFEIPGISWISLVKEIPAADRPALQKNPQVLDTSRQLTDFAQTAAVISQLDLVLSVDTAVAHLAGALGKPTWLLLPDVAEWRWLENRTDSPWYPTMRLFRQQKPADWPALIQQIAAELRKSPPPAP